MFEQKNLRKLIPAKISSLKLAEKYRVTINLQKELLKHEIPQLKS